MQPVRNQIHGLAVRRVDADEFEGKFSESFDAPRPHSFDHLAFHARAFLSDHHVVNHDRSVQRRREAVSREVSVARQTKVESDDNLHAGRECDASRLGMRPLTAIAIILLINHLGFAALVGWLMGTGRLDRQRLQSVRATFEKTIVQEQQENLQAKLLDEQQRTEQQEKQHLAQVAKGPMSIVRRISLEREAEQLLLEKTERAVQDLASIRNSLYLECDC